MRHGRLHGSIASRRLIAVLAGALALTLTLGVARAQPQTAPTNTALPTISGNATAGQILTAAPGNWGGTTPITYTYQWLKCDSAGNNCASIPGETTSHRAVDAGDVGHRLRVRVRATNTDGSTSATSAASALVAASGSGAPVNTKEPSIAGSTVQGQTLIANRGSWSGANPITYKYQWLRCDTNAANCNSIAGETSSNRTIVADDVGHRLRVRVTASNSSGSTSADSNGTAVVTAPADRARLSTPFSRRSPAFRCKDRRSSRPTAPGPARRRSRSPISGCAAMRTESVRTDRRLRPNTTGR